MDRRPRADEIAKTAALYSQDLADPVALAGVDQIESLTAGLSRKIWQKPLILERVVGRDAATGDPITGGPALTP